MLWLAAALAQDCDPTVDCDGDGFTADQGDCDESDPRRNPGITEDCTNDIDDDCDGLFNQGCDRAPQQGQLSGGSACGDSTPAAAFLFLPPLIWGPRRRR